MEAQTMRDQKDLATSERSESDRQLLFESERRLRALVTASSDAVYRMSADWSEMHQLKPHLEGQPFIAETEQTNTNWLSDYIYTPDRPAVLAAVEKAISDKMMFELEHRVLRVDGTLGWTLSRAVPLLSDQGEITEWFGMAIDVTERRLAQEREQEKEAQLRQVMEVTTDGVFILDRDWKFTYLNPKARTMLAASGELLGREYWEVYPENDVPGSIFYENYHRAMDEGISSDFTGYYPEPYDSWFQAIVRPSPSGITVFFRDVTSSRRATEALIQSEKLSAMGRLAASIAHEVNNPLEAVTNLIYLARTTETLPKAVEDYLAAAEEELSRAAAITNQTLGFYKQSANPTEIDGKKLVEGVLTLHKGRLRNSSVQVETRYRATLPVFCFEGEIRQVLSNLIGNASDAMQNNKPLRKLLVRTRDGCDHRAKQQGMMITVADTGPGMSSQTFRKAFEAFYTTKGMSGTGLGLWVSKEIVDRHNGHLQLKSSQREGSSGTVFRLFLPYAAVDR